MPKKKVSTKTARSSVDSDSRYRAPALDKGLDILELFAEEDSPMALSEVARKLDRTVGEIFRMVATLERRGYLRLDPQTDLYELTLLMFRLSHRHMPVHEINRASTKPLRRLTRDVSQSCQISVPFRGQGLIIVQENSPTDRGFRVRLGSSISLANTCSGKILLAFMDEGQRTEALELAHQLGGKYAEVPANLEEDLEKIRKRGYNQEKSQFTQGVTDVGCPVFGHDGVLEGALTIPFLGRIGGNQVDLKTAREKLIQTAQKISENMGYDSDSRRALS